MGSRDRSSPLEWALASDVLGCRLQGGDTSEAVAKGNGTHSIPNAPVLEAENSVVSGGCSPASGYGSVAPYL